MTHGTFDRATVVEFLESELGVDLSDVANSDPLFSSGIVDSFALVTLMMHLEQQGGFRINPGDVTSTISTRLIRIIVAAAPWCSIAQSRGDIRLRHRSTPMISTRWSRASGSWIPVRRPVRRQLRGLRANSNPAVLRALQPHLATFDASSFAEVQRALAADAGGAHLLGASEAARGDPRRHRRGHRRAGDRIPTRPAWPATMPAPTDGGSPAWCGSTR